MQRWQPHGSLFSWLSSDEDPSRELPEDSDGNWSCASTSGFSDKEPDSELPDIGSSGALESGAECGFASWTGSTESEPSFLEVSVSVLDWSVSP